MADKVHPSGSGRTAVVSGGRLPISEFAAELQGGLSPFGEDTEFPLPPDQISYHHPGPEDRPRLAGEPAAQP